MKILIASPTYDGSVRKEYMRSVMVLTDFLNQSGVLWEMMVEPSSMLHVMRSVMASKALMDPQITHILFVDTDMGFSATAVKKMIDAKVDIIGCAYPYRTVPLHETIAKSGVTYRESISQVVPYAVQFPNGKGSFEVTNGICEVSALGTGLILISKQALQAMVSKGVAEPFATGFPYSQWYEHNQYYGFFDYLKVDGAYIGEDYSFCKRWTQDCGGKIFAVVDEEVMHIGAMPVIGRYIDKIKSGKL